MSIEHTEGADQSAEDQQLDDLIGRAAPDIPSERFDEIIRGPYPPREDDPTEVAKLIRSAHGRISEERLQGLVSNAVLINRQDGSAAPVELHTVGGLPEDGGHEVPEGPVASALRKRRETADEVILSDSDVAADALTLSPSLREHPDTQKFIDEFNAKFHMPEGSHDKDAEDAADEVISGHLTEAGQRELRAMRGSLTGAIARPDDSVARHALNDDPADSGHKLESDLYKYGPGGEPVVDFQAARERFQAADATSDLDGFEDDDDDLSLGFESPTTGQERKDSQGRHPASRPDVQEILDEQIVDLRSHRA